MADKYYSQIEELSLPSRNYVLVIPAWYPTWQDPFTGDFNERHVKAAGIYKSQVVLYVVKDQTGALKKIETRYRQATDNIVEITVIYPQKNFKWFDTIYSNLIYITLLFTYSKLIKHKWGLPSLIHSYIIIRGGLGGLLLSKKWKIPFILSENWTIYYPEDPGYLLKRNAVFKWTARRVLKNLDKLLPVTENLKECVFKVSGRIPSRVIPNVVDIGLFYLRENNNRKDEFGFVHVSNMNYQKNPEGLLRAFKKFHDLNEATCLYMIGPHTDQLPEYAREIGLDENAVRFTGPVSYKHVAEILSMSKALVLFSRYENLPCVILEALCCGLPVISTAVGGITEVVNATNGLLVQSEDEKELTEAFCKMYTTYGNYDRIQISRKASDLFSYRRIGGLIDEIYEELKTTN